jgi:hypothetical protein
MQVHNAIAAHLNTQTQAVLPQAEATTTTATMATTASTGNHGMQSAIAGTPTDDTPGAPTTTDPLQAPPMHPRRSLNIPPSIPTLLQQAHLMHRHTITAPALLQGTRCYVDASTQPDHLNPHSRMAGLGVFIIKTQEHPIQSIYIKAKLLTCSSVLMAEAASLALAASIIYRLNINGCNFLSDCEQLVHSINSADHSNPSDWRIKPFT